MALSSIAKLRYCEVGKRSERDSCLLHSMTFKAGPFGWVTKQSALRNRLSTLGWYHNNLNFMCAIKNARSILEEYVDKSDIALVTRFFNVVFEE